MDKNTFSYLMRRFYDEIKSADVDEAYETFMLILDLVFIEKDKVPKFFQELLDKDTLSMIDDISLVKYQPKEVICKEGSRDHQMFVIVSGTVRISKKPTKAKGPLLPLPPVLLNHLITTLITGGSKTLSHLSVGDFFGESALFSSKPMEVSAIAETDVELLIVTDKSLQKAMTVKPNLSALLKEYYVSRLDSMVEFLQNEHGQLQACAFGAMLDKIMPDNDSSYADSAMLMGADRRDNAEAALSLKPRSAVEAGLQKVIALYAANRKHEAALVYLSMMRVFFKDIATVTARAALLAALKNGSIRNIKPLYDMMGRLHSLIPEQTTEPDIATEPDYHESFLLLFKDLLNRKLEKARELKFTQGQEIVRYGDASDSIFVVKLGAVNVYPHRISPDTSDDSGITTVSDGGIFGDFDFFNKKPRTATVIAAGAVTLYELDRPLVTEI
ncbi:MAG: cyclic nucleotide-binding domain-containing protein, partial [Candidatus Magnetominusculus sp. LBB02]|nr:cyclic nucleotide-binding domain-containing protein [Candidatus Magnetominusculus sp. LBB02]